MQYPTISNFNDKGWKKVNFPPIDVHDIKNFQYYINLEMSEVNTESNGSWMRENNPIVTTILVANNQNKTVLTTLDDTKYSHQPIKMFDTTNDTTNYTGKTTLSNHKGKNYIGIKTGVNTANALYDAQDDIQFTY